MVINPILFPVSTSCNLRCLYCFHREDHTPISEDFLMSDAVLSRVTSELLKVGPNRVRFIWHGGEPLLAGLEFYKKVVYFQEKYRGENQQIKNAIQTNGTLLTPEYIEFCKEHGFGVGVSIDGPEWLQNYQRPSASGKGTFQKVMDGINLLTDSRAKFGGILAVVTRNSLPHSKELYEFMRGNFQSFDFLPCFEIAQRTKNPISLSVDHIGFANFMIDIFDMWFEDDDPSIRIRTLNDITKVLLGGKPSLCRYSNTCPNFISIDYNGDVYPCDRFAGMKEFKFGNIMETPLEEILNGSEYEKFAREATFLSEECNRCPWLPACNNYCAYHRYIGNGKFEAKSRFCAAQKRVMEHIYKRIKEMLPGDYPHLLRV